jgi:acid phosphatase type 7
MSTRRGLGVLLGLGAVIAAVLLGLHGCEDPAATTVRAVAVGGMVCDPTDPEFNEGRGTARGCQHRATSEAAVALGPDALLGLGDYQFEVPASASYRDHYDTSWGRLRDVTIPAVGNQEYKVKNANTYRDYFGDRAAPETGYWATDLGAWRVIVLNSNCTTVEGGCAEGSPQWRWLDAELSSNSARCTVALWHHPRWSNGIAGADARTEDLVRLMADRGVDIGLSAHEADYERFRPMDGDGRADDSGIRTFVVGTGGQAVYQPGEGDAEWRSRQTSTGSEHFDARHHGFLELVLAPGRYEWRFHAVTPGTPGEHLGVDVTDAGAAACTERPKY